jgi:hypothetical protein
MSLQHVILINIYVSVNHVIKGENRAPSLACNGEHLYTIAVDPAIMSSR